MPVYIIKCKQEMDMAYLIQTNMTNGRLHPLFWTGTESVGILRKPEAARYSTLSDATTALALIAPRLVRFYDLIVIEESNAEHLPPMSNNAFMVRHPGYDPVH